MQIVGRAETQTPTKRTTTIAPKCSSLSSKQAENTIETQRRDETSKLFTKKDYIPNILF